MYFTYICKWNPLLCTILGRLFLDVHLLLKTSLLAKISVTRLGDLLDFGQVFYAFGNNLFAKISHILRQFL